MRPGRRTPRRSCSCHGFPTSSHLFRDLIPQLSDRFRAIALDYPGFGYSSMPAVDEFDDTFDTLAGTFEELLDRLELTRYRLYVTDYGAPGRLQHRRGAPRKEKQT